MKLTTQILVALLLISSCQRETPAITLSNEADIYAIADTTDLHLMNPLSTPILELYKLAEDKNKKAEFQFTCITDKQLNPSIRFHLDNGAQTEKKNSQDDPQFREKIVMAFYDSIRATISGFSLACEHMHSRQYSECYRTIATGLCALAKSNASKKWLLIYSDIQENSDIYCCYDTAKQSLLIKYPQKVADIFTKTCPLPQDLSGIHVVFVCMPKNRYEGKMYLAMTEVYKLLIESRGGTVKVQADNKNFEL